MWDWLERHKKPVIIILIGIILIGAGVFFYHQRFPSGAVEISLAPPQQITVCVEGAVKHPDTYELNSGARVANLITEAGGFKSDAYLGGINLEQELRDGEYLYIYTEDEALSRVNINTADIDELQKLHGIGPVKAQSIVDYRNEHGPFLSIEDIKNVPGIGDVIYSEIEDKIRVY